jgi:anti-sigma-K factor RskA
MTTAGHEAIREALGAYTVGALDPAERAVVEQHLSGCGACRDELARLAGLPALLSRLSADEVEAALQARPQTTAAASLEAMGRWRRGLRRELWGWRVAAAAAAAALLVVALPLTARDAEPVFSPQPVAADAAAMEASVRVAEQPWGMQVTLEAANLPPREGYALWALTDDDHRALAASWQPTSDGAVQLDGACYVSPDTLLQFELTDPEGEVLAVFEG